ncbi:Protein of unknown function [Paracoccus isoporae]|uniref:DUF3768 domain-containing protein n=1 Tax=Paracoccus isoporae TaxID=591205 RepID=A0A1G7G774_9RHOB|nr:DUF3768 domain-containing protein [Paracoccus isoporae]SDE83972.1 Protein of unknown function [Paracoccus isoporae]
MLDADKQTYTCRKCSHNFDVQHQPSQCPACGHTGAAREFPTVETHLIAQQNDAFRKGMIAGLPRDMLGRIVSTPGVRAMGRDFETAAYVSVAKDTVFSEANDPWGARDFGAVSVNGTKVWWKIDLYNNDFDGGSEAPCDLAQTRRLVTILLPSEY